MNCFIDNETYRPSKYLRSDLSKLHISRFLEIKKAERLYIIHTLKAYFVKFHISSSIFEKLQLIINKLYNNSNKKNLLIY